MSAKYRHFEGLQKPVFTKILRYCQCSGSSGAQKIQHEPEVPDARDDDEVPDDDPDESDDVDADVAAEVPLFTRLKKLRMVSGYFLKCISDLFMQYKQMRFQNFENFVNFSKCFQNVRSSYNFPIKNSSGDLHYDIYVNSERNIKVIYDHNGNATIPLEIIDSNVETDDHIVRFSNLLLFITMSDFYMCDDQFSIFELRLFYWKEDGTELQTITFSINRLYEITRVVHGTSDVNLGIIPAEDEDEDEDE